MRRFHRTDRRTWSLLDGNGHVLGSKGRPNWWSQRAEITVANGLYLVKGRTSWTTDLAVFFGEVPVLVGKLRWRDTAITEIGSTLPLVTLRRKHWFSNVYQLVDAQGLVRASLEIKLSWKTMDMEPRLLEESGEPLSPLVLLFAVQIITVQQQRSAAAS